MKTPIAIALFGVSWACASGAEPARALKNVVVFQEAGRFGGWPANHGIWSWGNEILVGFEAGYFKDKAQGHAIDYARPAQHALARSLDGALGAMSRGMAQERPDPPSGERRLHASHDQIH